MGDCIKFPSVQSLISANEESELVKTLVNEQIKTATPIAFNGAEGPGPLQVNNAVCIELSCL